MRSREGTLVYLCNCVVRPARDSPNLLIDSAATELTVIKEEQSSYRGDIHGS